MTRHRKDHRNVCVQEGCPLNGFLIERCRKQCPSKGNVCLWKLPVQKDYSVFVFPYIIYDVNCSFILTLYDGPEMGADCTGFYIIEKYL